MFPALPDPAFETIRGPHPDAPWCRCVCGAELPLCDAEAHRVSCVEARTCAPLREEVARGA